jgi:hypothetical protein
MPIETIAVGKSLKTINDAAFYANPNLKTVFYRGSEADWKAVEVKMDNQDLLKAEVKYLGNKDFCSCNVHSVALVKPYKEATETEDGNYEYYKCTNCGKLLFVSCGTEDRYSEITEADTIIPATGVSEYPTPYDEPSDPGTDNPPQGEGSGVDPTPAPSDEQSGQAVITGTPEITLSATDYTYKFAVKKVKVGKKRKKQAVATEYVPTVSSVKLNGKTLTAADYEVSYSDPESKALGQYTVTVTLKGKYNGTGTATYSINPKPAKISKPAGGKKKMTVKWKKAAKNDITYKALDGYEIQYSLSSDFSSDDTRTTTASKKAKSKAIKKLQSKQTYYVRIRTYKNAGGVRLYSGWSAVKSVKIK